MIAMSKAALPSIRSIPTDWLRDANSFLLSAIFHLTALVLLALLMMRSDKGWSDLQLFAQMNDGVDAPLGGGEALDESLGRFQVEPQEAALAAGPITIFDTNTALVSNTAAVESPLDAMATGGLEGSSIGDGSGGSLAGGGGDGNGGAEFFGIGGKGGSFVYVVDLSGSMNEDGKWERARAELMRSIEHLTQDQQYYIIFYNDGWYPMASDKPILATTKAIDRTRRWVHRLWPGGGTFPLEALEHAPGAGAGRRLLPLRRPIRPGGDRDAPRSKSFLQRPDPDPHDRLREPGNDRHHATDRQTIGREVSLRTIVAATSRAVTAPARRDRSCIFLRDAGRAPLPASPRDPHS